VVGGVFFSTFLTLVLVPVLYTLLARFTKKSTVSVEQTEEATQEVETGAGIPAAAREAG
jgi:hypothetical protein